MPDTQPLTDEQKQSMTDLMRLVHDDEVPIALMAATLDGATPVALVTAVAEDGEHMNMHPLAIVITDDLFERLTPPEDEDGQQPQKIAVPREAEVSHEGGTITVDVNEPVPSAWEHPRLEDWQYAVSNGDTTRGFHEWLEHEVDHANAGFEA